MLSIEYWKAIGFSSRNEDKLCQIEPDKQILLQTLVRLKANIEQYDYSATDFIFSNKDKEEVLNLNKYLNKEENENPIYLWGTKVSFSNQIEPGFALALSLNNDLLTNMDYKYMHRCICYAQIKKE